MLPIDVMCSYNSSVFSSISANEYHIYSVNQRFVDPKSANFTTASSGSCSWSSVRCRPNMERIFNTIKTDNWERLEPAQCLEQYVQPFQTTRGDLLLVAPDDAFPSNRDSAFIMYGDEELVPTDSTNQCPPYTWICGTGCSSPRGFTPCQYRLAPFRQNITSWRPFGNEVKYCLSEPIEQHCRLLYSPYLALIVILFNVFKAIIMLYLAFGLVESPLLTIGDAVSSFLQRPDLTTQGICLAGRDDFSKNKNVRFDNSFGSKQYKNEIKSRAAAASSRRWHVCIFLLVFAVIFLLGILADILSDCLWR